MSQISQKQQVENLQTYIGYILPPLIVIMAIGVVASTRGS